MLQVQGHVILGLSLVLLMSTHKPPLSDLTPFICQVKSLE